MQKKWCAKIPLCSKSGVLKIWYATTPAAGRSVGGRSAAVSGGQAGGRGRARAVFFKTWE